MFYVFESHPVLSEAVSRLHDRMLARGDALLTSFMTAGELVVAPYRLGRHELADSYLEALDRTAALIAFDAHCTRAYADVRTDPSIRLPDAIQLACAAAGAADVFITNDARLARVRVPGSLTLLSLAEALATL